MEASWDRISFLQSLVAMSVSDLGTAEALEPVLFVVNLRCMVMLAWSMELVMSVGSFGQPGYNYWAVKVLGRIVDDVIGMVTSCSGTCFRRRDGVVLLDVQTVA